MQSDLSDVKNDVKNVQKDISVLKNDVTNVQKDLMKVQADIQVVKTTVDRRESAQIDDVIGILKVSKKKTDFEVDYLNNRITELDKRLYVLERR